MQGTHPPWWENKKFVHRGRSEPKGFTGVLQRVLEPQQANRRSNRAAESLKHDRPAPQEYEFAAAGVQHIVWEDPKGKHAEAHNFLPGYRPAWQSGELRDQRWRECWQRGLTERWREEHFGVNGGEWQRVGENSRIDLRRARHSERQRGEPWESGRWLREIIGLRFVFPRQKPCIIDAIIEWPQIGNWKAQKLQAIMLWYFLAYCAAVSDRHSPHHDGEEGHTLTVNNLKYFKHQL